MSNNRCRIDIIAEHEVAESARGEDEKLWTGLWHATFPVEFIVVATQEKFNGSVWGVYGYITTRMDLASGKSRKLRNSEIREALGISRPTLDRAKATLKEYGFIVENDGDGSVYFAPDVAKATERAKLRQVRKQKEARLKKHEEFIADEEEKRGHHLSMRQRVELIKDQFDEKYRPSLDD